MTTKGGAVHRQPGRRPKAEGDYEEMSSEKKGILELVQRLPDSVTTADVMEELYSKQQVDKGLRDVAEGRVLTSQEIRERIERWRKSSLPGCVNCYAGWDLRNGFGGVITSSRRRALRKS